MSNDTLVDELLSDSISSVPKVSPKAASQPAKKALRIQRRRVYPSVEDGPCDHGLASTSDLPHVLVSGSEFVLPTFKSGLQTNPRRRPYLLTMLETIVTGTPLRLLFPESVLSGICSDLESQMGCV